jgi:hypothetical protein
VLIVTAFLRLADYEYGTGRLVQSLSDQAVDVGPPTLLARADEVIE